MTKPRDGWIYSTLATDIRIVKYERTEDGAPIEVAHVVIKGGAGVLGTKQFETPRGVITKVSATDIELLESEPIYKQLVKNGHLRLEYRQVDIDKIVADMKGRDNSAPIVPQDIPQNIKTRVTGTI